MDHNSQNATPEIQHLNALARANRIPIATVTETLSPAQLVEQWQVAPLRESRSRSTPRRADDRRRLRRRCGRRRRGLRPARRAARAQRRLADRRRGRVRRRARPERRRQVDADAGAPRPHPARVGLDYGARRAAVRARQRVGYLPQRRSSTIRPACAASTSSGSASMGLDGRAAAASPPLRASAAAPSAGGSTM